MDLDPWDPWREFERVREEADRLIERFLAKVRLLENARPIAFLPESDIIETGEDLRIFLSLSGVEEEDIDIAVEGEFLVVRGERVCPYDESHVRQLSEWRYGFFERGYRLAGGLETESLSASFLGGVLTIVIPKKESPSPPPEPPPEAAWEGT